MERRHSLAVSARWLIVLPLVSACNEDATPIDDEGDSSVDDGINSLDDDSATDTEAVDSTGDEPTSSEGSSMSDGPGEPSCMDDLFNQDETDVDCGGPTCDPCASGLDCLVATDCIDGVCEDGACQEPSCYDDVENGSEDGVDCEFRRTPGFLHSPWKGDDDSKALRDDANLARQLGFPAEFLDKVPVVGRNGVRFADQAKFHPMRYLNGVLSLLPEDGVVFEHSEVTEILDDPVRVVANGRLFVV